MAMVTLLNLICRYEFNQLTKIPHIKVLMHVISIHQANQCGLLSHEIRLCVVEEEAMLARQIIYSLCCS